MNVILVVGVAGSGKSTYCEKLCNEMQKSFIVSHDEWVHSLYDDRGTQIGLKAILGVDSYQGDLTRKDVLSMILKNPIHHNLVSAYFRNRFIFEKLVPLLVRGPEDDTVIVECPFICDTIGAIKYAYGDTFEIHEVNVPRETAFERLYERGWDEDRIWFSYDQQSEDLGYYSGLIDKSVPGVSAENEETVYWQYISTFGSIVDEGDGQVIATTSESTTHEQGQLMASAPRLLKALELAIEALDEAGYGDHRCDEHQFLVETVEDAKCWM